MGNNHCNADSIAVKCAESFQSQVMEQEYSLRKRPHSSVATPPRICLAIVALAYLLPSAAHAQSYGPNVLPAGNFESVKPAYVPWAGVDDKGNIHGLDGKQLSIQDDGSTKWSPFGPGIAVGDLNGDGKLDLVLADPYGYFWFFTNSGTVRRPVFTQGEIIPIWLGEDRVNGGMEGVDNVVPRIQLVDFDHNGHLDIVAGTFSGKLFRIHNVGSGTEPAFKPTYDRNSLLINTHKKGVLWCNYLAPFLTNQFGSPNSFDLVMGEGTYSANSIYLLRNTDPNGSPTFDEDHLQKIVTGMGLDQLTPAVVDWNNDGKPDIISGDRTGHLNLYLNTSTDPEHPAFAPGVPIKIAGADKFGASITVAVAHLSGNHLPNLLIGKEDGTVLYAENSGKPGDPSFLIPAKPLKGILPPEYHYTSSTTWIKSGAWGAPYEMLACVNPQLEPGFAFPEGEQSKYALKFFVWPVKNNYFSETYSPPVEDAWKEHVISCAQKFTLDLNKRYRVHFWIKADRNLSDLRYKIFSAGADHPTDVINPVVAGTSWTEISSNIKMLAPNDSTAKSWSFGFEFHFTGQPTIYIDDLQIQEVLN